MRYHMSGWAFNPLFSSNPEISIYFSFQDFNHFCNKSQFAKSMSPKKRAIKAEKYDNRKTIQMGQIQIH